MKGQRIFLSFYQCKHGTTKRSSQRKVSGIGTVIVKVKPEPNNFSTLTCQIKQSIQLHRTQVIQPQPTHYNNDNLLSGAPEGEC